MQVLFAFLLVAPFNQRFGTVSDFERKLYFATLLCTLLASILLIAPTVVHRLQFARGQKKSVVYTANRLTIAFRDKKQAGLNVGGEALRRQFIILPHGHAVLPQPSLRFLQDLGYFSGILRNGWAN